MLTWDYVQITPAAGLDGSWMVGLNLGAAAGLDHGTEIVFTYGPLGFLEQPMVFDGLLATLGAVYLLGIRTLLVASVLWAARRSFPWPAAAALTVGIALILPRSLGALPLALAAIWCLVALGPEPPRWAGRLLVIGGGALAGLQLLVKLNVGLTVLAMVAVATFAMSRQRARDLLTLAAVAAATFALLWLAAGQGIANLDDYVASSVEVISGYSEAMQADAATVGWDGWAAAAVAIATLTVALIGGGGLPALRRAGIVAVVALLTFSLFKYGFVRHDGPHVGAFFGTLGVVWIAFRWRGEARAVPLAGLAAIALVYFPIADETLESSLEPALAVDQLSTLVVPGERERETEAARAALQATYAVDPRIIERVGEAPVDVRPWELSLIWAYDLNWRPLPVLGDYTAYTPELDRLDAEALAAAEGPSFVIRHFGFDGNAATGIDGRYTSFDSPLVTRELLCGFEPALAADPYQLVARGADRCAEPRPLGSVSAEYGEPIEIPAGRPGEAVFASVQGAAAQGIERLRAFLYRGAIRHVELGESARARLVPRNAANGLLLYAPPAADYPDPFRLAPDVGSFAIDSEGGFASSDGPLEVEFSAVPIEDLPRPR